MKNKILTLFVATMLAISTIAHAQNDSIAESPESTAIIENMDVSYSGRTISTGEFNTRVRQELLWDKLQTKEVKEADGYKIAKAPYWINNPGQQKCLFLYAMDTDSRYIPSIKTTLNSVIFLQISKEGEPDQTLIILPYSSLGKYKGNIEETIAFMIRENTIFFTMPNNGSESTARYRVELLSDLQFAVTNSFGNKPSRSATTKN